MCVYRQQRNVRSVLQYELLMPRFSISLQLPFNYAASSTNTSTAKAMRASPREQFPNYGQAYEKYGIFFINGTFYVRKFYHQKLYENT
jgi:hypothetical protein